MHCPPCDYHASLSGNPLEWRRSFGSTRATSGSDESQALGDPRETFDFFTKESWCAKSPNVLDRSQFHVRIISRTGLHLGLFPDGSRALVGPMWAKRSQDRPTPGDSGGGRMGPVSRVTHCFTKRPIQQFTSRIEESLGTSLCRASRETEQTVHGAAAAGVTP